MTTLTQAHHQWATRPDDERFTSLDEMLTHLRRQRVISEMGRTFNRQLEARPIEDDPNGIAVMGDDVGVTAPSHWAFGQLCQLIGAPASYLRTLPSPLAADCINQSMLDRRVDQVGFMLRNDGVMPTLAAVTGPTYGRIWNEQIVEALVRRFGSGPDAEFTVPGEFGQQVEITKKNTTLFAGDQDMFLFLADERNKIEVPGRRNGETGLLSRGIFIQNSEVGASSLRIGTFLYDYVCSNRMVWGAEGFQEVAIRHSSKAPMRWLDEVAPAIRQLTTAPSYSIVNALQAARSQRLDDDQVDKVLAKRFTTNQAKAIKLAHMSDEGRPIGSVWDIVTGATAYARGIGHQDKRVAVERIAGQILADA